MNSFVKDFVREKVCLYTCRPWAYSYAELMSYGAEQGFRGVELLNHAEVVQPDMTAARELKKMAKEHGLMIPCFSVGLNLVGADRAENVEKVKRYAEICSDLEIPYLHHTVALRFSTVTDPEARLKYFAEGVEITSEIAEYANRLGVKTLLEDQGFVVNGVENYGRFRKEANNCFDVLLDVGNICFVDETAGAFAEAFSDNIVHTHVKEYHITKTAPEGITSYRTLGGSYLSNAIAGEGDIDYDRVKKVLERIGYSGVYSMEYNFKTPEEQDRTLEFLAETFGKM